MQRITVSLDDEIVEMIDRFMTRRGATNRSEALRDMVRAAAAQDTLEDTADDSPCVATLSYVYDHERRDLTRRVNTAHHHRHDLSVATMHVHLDHGTCLEVSVLKGPAAELRGLADEVTNERGVRHGRLHVLPQELEPGEPHSHAETEKRN
ncbi:nickel-responsive transcriptional regulator NikR [Oceanicella sp. SM1341]|uniref:nickel-responsive transcriptional regulator NikR n=1 Tax=Oceanicella sp. SM1341 TaxID=1548889 RepID=UPI000E47D5AA|nr:nickel-responsive transcriptional regulator NikR [Oceanicella sp. SM1341]